MATDPRSYSLAVTAEVSVQALAEMVVEAVSDDDALIELVVAVDHEVCDLGFTRTLRDRLSALIEAEEAGRE
jgi:hypothetical protein